MADDAHRQLRGASSQSLELLFKGLRELERRQRACEDALHGIHGHVEENTARLDADGKRFARDDERFNQAEQAMRDAVNLAVRLHEAEEGQAAAASGEVPQASRPGRPKLRLIVGGLAVAVPGLLIPAAAHAVNHHHARHVAAVRCHDQRGRRCADADGGKMGT